MDSTKIIGWLTFGGGVLIIIFALYSSYDIFTGQADVPPLFKLESEPASAPTPNPSSPEEMQQALIQQLKELFPMEVISKFINLGVWTMLAWILILGGAQIANLGIKLIKQEKNT